MSNPPREIFDSAFRSAPGHACGLAARNACRRAWVRASGVLRHALPQLCALCAAPCGASLLCAGCAGALPRLGRPCPCCALPTPGGGVCERCTVTRPPWTRAHAAFAYAYPLDRMLHAFKYRGALGLGPLFAQALAQGVRATPEAIVALPLAVARQRERGYNQAAEIARPLARALRLPLVAALARTRDTPALAALPWRDRHGSVAGAFAATLPLRGRTVALVDDVLTTGATLRAATLALLDAGAARVDVWVVARTLPPQ